jgi:hypothetical protein
MFILVKTSRSVCIHVYRAVSIAAGCSEKLIRSQQMAVASLIA